MRSFCVKQFDQRQDVNRHGFVLAMALVLILVAGITLASVARKSLAIATEVATTQEALQRRWGTISCRRLFLENAEQVLEGLAEPVDPKLPPRWPLPAKLNAEFQLGQLDFTILLADEEAKINLNKLYHRDRQLLEQVVTTQLFAEGSNPLVKQIQPPVQSPKKRQPALFLTWGQIYSVPENLSPLQTANYMRDATQGLTLWGSGRLNLRRASDETIKQLADRELPTKLVNQLLYARREPGVQKLDDVLKQVELKGVQRSTARQLFTDKSQVHSLWIQVRSPRQAWTQFVLDQADPESGANSQTFTY